MLMRTMLPGDIIVLVRDRTVIGRIMNADTVRCRFGIDLDRSVGVFPERWFPHGTDLSVGAVIPLSISLDRVVMAKGCRTGGPASAAM